MDDAFHSFRDVETQVTERFKDVRFLTKIALYGSDWVAEERVLDNGHEVMSQLREE